MSNKLSKNFTLEELTFSQTATRRGIDNTPGPDERDNLQMLANYLQGIRDALNDLPPPGADDAPLIVSSGYRCPKLNQAIGGSSTSEHMDGRAADIGTPGMTPLQLAKYIDQVMPDYNQLIHEFGRWVHVSIPEEGQPPKRQQLTEVKTASGVEYKPGLIEA